MRASTSNTQSWTATRDVQPRQTTAAPPDGNYTGADPNYDVSDPITFSVAGATLQNIAIPNVYMTCAPGDAQPIESLAIAAAPINSHRSFSVTTIQHAVYLGHPATFTYTFQGNFHGVDQSGAARAAGTFRETLAYTDSAARNCTSNNQYWTASLGGV